MMHSKCVGLLQPLQVTMTGGGQNGLPTDYQEKLRAIKTNAFEAPLPVMAELSKPAREAEPTGAPMPDSSIRAALHSTSYCITFSPASCRMHRWVCGLTTVACTDECNCHIVVVHHKEQ